MRTLFKNIPIGPRACYWYSFLICMGLLGFALYLEIGMALAPCPLCELQRLMFLLVGLCCLFAGLQNPKRRGIIIYSLLISLFCLGGGLLAGHQLWLEVHPPAAANSCGMSLGYLLNALPLSQALRVAIMGTGDCAVVTWRLLGLSIPAWSLIAFIGLGITALYQIRRAPKL
jgi:disulfide bond formation protein DsbB